MSNRDARNTASQKHVREYEHLLQQARAGATMAAPELALLRPLLAPGPEVVHLQSGHGMDDVALIAQGARSMVGVDFSTVAVVAAQQRSGPKV